MRFTNSVLIVLLICTNTVPYLTTCVIPGRSPGASFIKKNRTVGLKMSVRFKKCVRRLHKNMVKCSYNQINALHKQRLIFFVDMHKYSAPLNHVCDHVQTYFRSVKSITHLHTVQIVFRPPCHQVDSALI